MFFSRNLLFCFLVAVLPVNSLYASDSGRVLELGLTECLQLARENNLDLANAAWEVSKAETQVDIADGSRLPEVQFSTTYTRMGDESGSAIPGIEVPDSQADLSLNAAVPLYTGGLLKASGKQARTGLDIARENYRAAQGDLLLETTTAFYQLLRAQQQVLIAEEALDASRRHEKDIEALLRRGIVARVDLVRSQLDVSERERDLASAETERLLASERLSAILFPDGHNTVKARGDFPEPVQLDPVENWQKRASELSPELSMSSLSVKAARSDVSFARAEVRGTLSLFGTYGTSSDEFTLDEESRYWNTGVNYTLPLYSGGRMRSKVLNETHSLAQAENSLVTARRAVREAVTIAWSGARLAVTQSKTAASAIASAEENLRVITLKYQQGLVPNTDVIDAQLSLTRSRLLKVNSLADFNIYFAQLRRTAGAIEEMP
jgi:outer membrane protein TolC